MLTLSGSASVIEFALKLLDYQSRLGFRLQKRCLKCPHLLLRPVYSIFANKFSGFEMSQRSPRVMMCRGVGFSEQRSEVWGKASGRCSGRPAYHAMEVHIALVPCMLHDVVEYVVELPLDLQPGRMDYV